MPSQISNNLIEENTIMIIPAAYKLSLSRDAYKISAPRPTFKVISIKRNGIYIIKNRRKLC